MFPNLANSISFDAEKKEFIEPNEYRIADVCKHAKKRGYKKRLLHILNKMKRITNLVLILFLDKNLMSL